MLESFIEVIVAILLYSMFCQIPFFELKKTLKDRSFFKALLLGNFVLIPLFVWILTLIFPTTPIVKLGIFLVLLTPCIDYVVVFSYLGKGNAKAILASTPLLFILQVLLLPLYLWLFLGKETIGIMEVTPFAKAFFYLIVIPFLLSVATQRMSSAHNHVGCAILNFTAWLPVPFMALTFFVVIASQVNVLFGNPEPIVKVVPVYIAFAIIAPFIGKLSARIFKVGFYESRAISFSTSTRNSLVVLPMALALPTPEKQLVVAVIVTQTIVEILSELVYIKTIPILIKES